MEPEARAERGRVGSTIAARAERGLDILDTVVVTDSTNADDDDENDVAPDHQLGWREITRNDGRHPLAHTGRRLRSRPVRRPR